jgi:hypothetical protein
MGVAFGVRLGPLPGASSRRQVDWRRGAKAGTGAPATREGRQERCAVCEGSHRMSGGAALRGEDGLVSQASPQLLMSAGAQPLPRTACQLDCQEKLPVALALRAVFRTATKLACCPADWPSDRKNTAVKVMMSPVPSWSAGMYGYAVVCPLGRSPTSHCRTPAEPPRTTRTPRSVRLLVLRLATAAMRWSSRVRRGWERRR